MEKSGATAAACSRQSCLGCEIEGQLLCMAGPREVVDFGVLFVNWFIPFLGGMIIGRLWIGLALWFVLAVLFCGYIEALLFCRHCPAYAEKGFTLRCHANWGMPKIPRFDPRPVSRFEGLLVIAYAAALLLYYVPVFILSQQWLLLTWCTWALVIWVWIVQRTQCTRCYHLSCPGNRVPEEVRQGFFRNFSEFAKTWEQDRQAGRGLKKSKSE